MNQPAVRSHYRTARAALLALTASLQLAAAPAEGGDSKGPLKIHSARASSTLGNFLASNAIDGVVSDASRWVSQASTEPAWLESSNGQTRCDQVKFAASLNSDACFPSILRGFS
jgi:hypothetical protein